MVAEDPDAAISARMRSYVWRLPSNPTGTSTVYTTACASSSTARLQSIPSKYHRASTELHTPSTLNTKHDTFHTKHHSER